MELPHLDPVLHQVVRMTIMAALLRNGRVAFTRLRDEHGLTPGNLATHARKLEAAGLIRSRRVLSGTHFAVVYELTTDGRNAFQAYLEQLNAMVETIRRRPRA